MLLTSLDDSEWQLLYLSSLYVIVFLEDSKWQLLYLRQLVYLQSYYFSINEYLSGNLAEKFVMNLYLQKLVVHHQQI